MNNHPRQRFLKRWDGLKGFVWLQKAQGQVLTRPKASQSQTRPSRRFQRFLTLWNRLTRLIWL
jgi:hypothetical protein